MNTTKNGYANHLVENDFLTYVIESHHHLNLGDRVKIKGMELVVAESIATMKQGILTYSYLLTLEEGIRQEPIYPAFLAGAALEGKIIDVHKTMVRVHLVIDEEQSKEEATWFPCNSLYTGEGHTGFYCMPEIGDTVHLFFLNSKEEEAVVYRGWRKSGETNSKTG
ncbi:phage baseplate assembly protein V [Bacillus sp. Hm123]|uniref:phage baseplate assembly protein V n=1 Tax=Bacillus sp. Hm123 TaxID=3450745 RepID=UPI003F41C543